MKIENKVIKEIGIFENERNKEYSTVAIPFADIKDIMGSSRYLRFRFFKNKYFDYKENSHQPKYKGCIYSTTTEKVIQLQEEEFDDDICEYDKNEIIEVLQEVVRLMYEPYCKCGSYDDRSQLAFRKLQDILSNNFGDEDYSVNFG